MKITREQTILKYIALMQLLYEMSDDINLKDSVFNTKIIKDRCFDLQRSLKKEIWKIYHEGKDGIRKIDNFERSEQWNDAMIQHAEAAQTMSEYFDLGMLMNELDDVRAQGLQTQLTILLNTYGIKIDEI